MFELWCNGNTADFGSVVLGSNPGSSTAKKRPLIKRDLFWFLATIYNFPPPESSRRMYLLADSRGSRGKAAFTDLTHPQAPAKAGA